MKSLLAFLLPGLLLSLCSCGFSGVPEGAVVGRAALYDYSPSIIQSGDVQQFWWCGQGQNPEDPSQNTDTILYSSINTRTHATSNAIVVLGETPNAWDSAYVCNPKVVQGTFVNPLNDGKTYAYVMYYVGTLRIDGTENSIGAAFSTDGVHWTKYPQPVITPSAVGSYGVAQPAAYNSDKKSGIWVFYEDNVQGTHHVKAVSTDGLHFTTSGTITTNGLDPNNPNATWGDMAFDSTTHSWYAAFNLPSRLGSTTGYQDPVADVNLLEHGQYGVQLYRIPDDSLITGSKGWQQLKTIDTNLVGNECNFIPGFLRDSFGTVNVGSYPMITLYISFSNPTSNWDNSPAEAGSTCRIATWDIGTASWSPNESTLTLNQYYNKKTHEVTTGWIDPQGGFLLQTTLGHLYESPQKGATTPFYGCKSGSTDYFVSLDPSCEGARILGLDGYGYAQQSTTAGLVSLFRCNSGTDHFVSTDGSCDGAKNEKLLGYALP